MIDLLLCTDMDRTLIPNGMQSEAENARRHFAELCVQPSVVLVYVTGRHLELMQAAIREYDLPQPDYAITDVGTRIYHQQDGDWQAMREWDDAIHSPWAHITAEQVFDFLAGIDGLTSQENEKQNVHKISFYADVTKLDEAHCLATVSTRLAPLDMPSNLIWSIDETSQTGLLDILPPNAHKLAAIEFLQQFLKCEDKAVVFAGDSGNDLQVLASPIQSVLVANATEQLKQQAQELAIHEGNQQQFYQAENREKNDGNYSAGILQGVFHYRPELQRLMKS